MNDPVSQKLKADAWVVLADLWCAIGHWAPIDGSRQRSALPNDKDAAPVASSAAADRPSGLCYFHLN